MSSTEKSVPLSGTPSWSLRDPCRRLDDMPQNHTTVGTDSIAAAAVRLRDAAATGTPATPCAT